MSVQVMAWVLDHAPSDLAPSEMLVALVLANHTTRDGGHAYPKIETLAKETHLSERGVQLALRGLEKRGIIEIEKPATNKLPAMYGFPMFRGANSAPQEIGGAVSSPQGCSEFTSGGAVSAPNPLGEPLGEPLDTPLSPPTGGKPKRASQMTDDWEPSGELTKWAGESLALTFAQQDHETEKFKDHFKANGKPMKDWNAAWKNWMRRSREFGSARSSPNGHAPEPRRPAIPRFEDIAHRYGKEGP